MCVSVFACVWERKMEKDVCVFDMKCGWEAAITPPRSQKQTEMDLGDPGHPKPPRVLKTSGHTSQRYLRICGAWKDQGPSVLGAQEPHCLHLVTHLPTNYTYITHAHTLTLPFEVPASRCPPNKQWTETLPEHRIKPPVDLAGCVKQGCRKMLTIPTK